MKAPVGVAVMSSALAIAASAVVAITVAAALAGCDPRAPAPVAPAAPAPPASTLRVRGFSDSLAVTAIADSPSTLLVGTARGLIRWEGGRYSMMTQKDGLPADRVAGIAVDG